MSGGSYLPEHVRRRVIIELYRQADELGWETMTAAEKTERYNSWLDDDEVGGLLTQFMSRERARVWLKDGPLKEYARAQEGIGPFAPYVQRRTPGPHALVKQALGERWGIIEGSVQEKPNRCRANSGDEEVLMIWGAPANLRDLVWAAILAKVERDLEPIIVIATRYGTLLSEQQKAWHERVGRQIGVAVKHVSQRLVPNDALSSARQS